jgi:hypothetical protein
MAGTDWASIINLATQGLGAAGQIAAARSAGRAGGRQQEASNQLAVDQFGQDNYRTEQNARLDAGQMAEQARLDRAKLGIEAPQARTQQALYGDLIQHLRDAKVTGLGSHIPNIQVEGGLRPSAISQAGRNAAGSALQTQAMQALLSGSDVPAMPDFNKLLLAAPDATPLPQAGREDSILNTLATLGAGAQAGSEIYDATKRRRQVPIAANTIAQTAPFKLPAVNFGRTTVRG